MKISGLVRSSLIDYPGKIAAVIFTQGCNFRCGFCHNPDLICIENAELDKNIDEIFIFLEFRRGKLDGVVITGGEPLIHPDIIDFIKRIKSLGFLVKIDTNGSNPDKLSQLINLNLVDYIAMDIKGPLEKYEEIFAYSNTKVIQKSIDIIKNSGLGYEFRTTVLPHYHSISDFDSIGKLINGAAKYTIQGFRPSVTLEAGLQGAEVFTKAQLDEIAKVMAPYVENVVIHENS